MDKFKKMFDGITFAKGTEIVFVQEGSKLVTKIDGQKVGSRARVCIPVVAETLRLPVTGKGRYGRNSCPAQGSLSICHFCQCIFHMPVPRWGAAL